MAEKQKGKSGQDGSKTREDQLREALEEVNNNLLEAVPPLSVLFHFFREQDGSRRDVQIDNDTMFEIGSMVIRAYERVKAAYEAVADVA